ncbi:hypothetical protein BTVI_16244 [Pitangus sulphuratus]|nr:hypothetical protein BTVI_16244 [Pitangus sulphuratus]
MIGYEIPVASSTLREDSGSGLVTGIFVESLETAGKVCERQVWEDACARCRCPEPIRCLFNNLELGERQPLGLGGIEIGSSTMGTAEDAEWLRWVTKQFGSIAGKDKEISLEEFKSALQVKESFFAERFFALFDADGSGTISLEELLRALRLLVHGDQGDKLSFLFQVYDVDGSGSIEADELQLVLRWCLRESSVSLPEERLGDLTRALLEAADRDHSGSITFPELREQLEAFPELMENLTIRDGVGMGVWMLGWVQG